MFLKFFLIFLFFTPIKILAIFPVMIYTCRGGNTQIKHYNDQQTKKMRYSRHDKILEIIEKNEIETQEALAERLAESGYNVTQSTVSRDIKDLQLIKVQLQDGRSVYTLPSAEQAPAASITRFERIFANTVRSIASSGNIIVIKTISGCANAAAEALESMDTDGILGTIAGDNTIFAVADSPELVPEILNRYRKLLEQGNS